MNERHKSSGAHRKSDRGLGANRRARPGAAHGLVRLLGGGSDAVERALDAPTVRTGIVISGHRQRDGARIESLGWPVQPGDRCVSSRSAVLPQVWIRADI
jgi:hypothetical protein